MQMLKWADIYKNKIVVAIMVALLIIPFIIYKVCRLNRIFKIKETDKNKVIITHLNTLLAFA